MGRLDALQVNITIATDASLMIATKLFNSLTLLTDFCMAFKRKLCLRGFSIVSLFIVPVARLSCSSPSSSRST